MAATNIEVTNVDLAEEYTATVSINGEVHTVSVGDEIVGPEEYFGECGNKGEFDMIVNVGIVGWLYISAPTLRGSAVNVRLRALSAVAEAVDDAWRRIAAKYQPLGE